MESSRRDLRHDWALVMGLHTEAFQHHSNSTPPQSPLRDSALDSVPAYAPTSPRYCPTSPSRTSFLDEHRKATALVEKQRTRRAEAEALKVFVTEIRFRRLSQGDAFLTLVARTATLTDIRDNEVLGVKGSEIVNMGVLTPEEAPRNQFAPLYYAYTSELSPSNMDEYFPPPCEPSHRFPKPIDFAEAMDEAESGRRRLFVIGLSSEWSDVQDFKVAIDQRREEFLQARLTAAQKQVANFRAELEAMRLVFDLSSASLSAVKERLMRQRVAELDDEESASKRRKLK